MATITINNHDGGKRFVAEVTSKKADGILLCRDPLDCKERALQFLIEHKCEEPIEFKEVKHGD
jgi:hypothetical protein